MLTFKKKNSSCDESLTTPLLRRHGYIIQSKIHLIGRGSRIMTFCIPRWLLTKASSTHELPNLCQLACHRLVVCEPDNEEPEECVVEVDIWLNFGMEDPRSCSSGRSSGCRRKSSCENRSKPIITNWGCGKTSFPDSILDHATISKTDREEYKSPSADGYKRIAVVVAIHTSTTISISSWDLVEKDPHEDRPGWVPKLPEDEALWAWLSPPRSTNNEEPSWGSAGGAGTAAATILKTIWVLLFPKPWDAEISVVPSVEASRWVDT